MARQSRPYNVEVVYPSGVSYDDSITNVPSDGTLVTAKNGKIYVVRCALSSAAKELFIVLDEPHPPMLGAD